MIALMSDYGLLHTAQSACWGNIFIVPLKIEFAIGMGPIVGPWRIAAKIVRITFHGAVYAAYHTTPASMSCG